MNLLSQTFRVFGNVLYWNGQILNTSCVRQLQQLLTLHTSLQMPFDCRVVIWPDKDQVLPFKTPVWFVKKKGRERERKKREESVCKIWISAREFRNIYLTHLNIFTWIMISDITSNLNYTCWPGRLRIQANWPGWPPSTGVKFQPCDDWLLLAGLCTLLLPFFDVFVPLLVLYCIAFWVPPDKRGERNLGDIFKKNTQCQWIDTTIQPDDTGQWIPCFDSSQNIIYWSQN